MLSLNTAGGIRFETRYPRRKRYLLAALAAVLGSATGLAPALAQEQLEPIVIESVTLSGDPVEPSKQGSSVTVITGEELKRRQIRHAVDALRTVPGVIVNRTGGVGGLTHVRIRGAEGNQLKVIIDGVEVNSLSSGEFDFATLLATEIERMEVVRGPQSGVYGANALAGVINIVTKKGGKPQVSATAEAGSFNTKQISANASGGTEQGYLSVTATHFETDGYNIARSGDEDDGGEKRAIFARAGFAPTDYLRVDAMGRVQSSFTENDRSDPPLDTPGASDENEQKLARISAELDTFEKRWTHKVFADYLDDSYTSKDEGLSPFTTEGERSRYGYQSTLGFNTGGIIAAKHTLTGLVEQIDESAKFSYETQAAERSQSGFAAEYQGEFASQFFLSSNIRFDDKDAFDDATTYRLAAAYLWPASGTRLHGSYGKGITDPTFFELYGRTSDFIGNPDLKPEESLGWDLGVEQKFWQNRVTVDVTYFQADLTDKIVGSGNTVRNDIGTSEREGVEVTVSAQVTPSLMVTGSYTYTDATDTQGQEELRRPSHAASLGVAYSFADGRGTINADAVYNGQMRDTDWKNYLLPAERVTMDDYLLVNVAASYKVQPNIELFGRIENALDTDYEEVFGYSTAPVAAYGGVRMTLGGDEAPIDAPLK